MYKTQMKAESIDDASQFRYPCYVSEKLDGWRCLICDGTMFTSGGKPFKPPVQERFKLIVDSAKAAGLVLDGELYIEGNSDFGLLSSTLSASVEVMAERGLRFHCFNAVTYDEWHGRISQEPFDDRLARYVMFCQKQIADYLIVPVEQHLCKDEAAADAYYERIKEAGGEGVMMRTPYGKYEPNKRSKDIVKRKVWSDCSARIVAIHQQACPVKQADEVREVDGVQQGFKKRAGSVTVEILPDQPLPAGTQQNTMFTPSAFHLRDLFWTERETLIGKVVDFEFLSGATKGRMGRIFRLREDIVVSSTSLGL
jgi:ATP-dependent DNA ligase